jgi:hypothetical protein
MAVLRSIDDGIDVRFLPRVTLNSLNSLMISVHTRRCRFDNLNGPLDNDCESCTRCRYQEAARDAIRSSFDRHDYRTFEIHSELPLSQFMPTLSVRSPIKAEYAWSSPKITRSMSR